MGLPKWLLHFTASTLEFSDLEKTLLPSKLAEWLKMTRGVYRKASGLPESLPDKEEKVQVKKEMEDSVKEAIGVQQQRITCLTASLDMARHVISEDIAAAATENSQVDNTSSSSIDVTLKTMPPPVVPLCDDEVISLLWTADFSVAKRLVWILETECAVVRGQKNTQQTLSRFWRKGRKELSVHRDTVEDARNGLRKLLGHMKQHPLWTCSPNTTTSTSKVIASDGAEEVGTKSDMANVYDTQARSAKQRLLAAWDETLLWMNTKHFFRLNTATSAKAAKRSLRNLEHIRGEMELKRQQARFKFEEQKKKEGVSSHHLSSEDNSSIPVKSEESSLSVETKPTVSATSLETKSAVTPNNLSLQQDSIPITVVKSEESLSSVETKTVVSSSAVVETESAVESPWVETKPTISPSIQTKLTTSVSSTETLHTQLPSAINKQPLYASVRV